MKTPPRLFSAALDRTCLPVLEFLRVLPESGDLAARRADREADLIEEIRDKRAKIEMLAAQLHEVRGLAMAEAKAAWAASEIASAKTGAAGCAAPEPFYDDEPESRDRCGT